jgi:hypothetical protein
MCCNMDQCHFSIQNIKMGGGGTRGIGTYTEEAIALLINKISPTEITFLKNMGELTVN